MLKKLISSVNKNKLDLYLMAIVFLIIPSVIACFSLLPLEVFIALVLSFLAQAIILTLYIRNS